MASTVGVIFSSINDENVPELTKVRSKGSIPYGGRYRLVDFALSNMVNSGITTVGMITNKNYQSLMDHLGTGKEWDLARKEGGLILLPPYSDESEMLYKNRLEGLKGASAFLRKCKQDFVVVADSDAVYRLDYSKMIEQHVKTNADITLAYHEHATADGNSYMVFETDKNEKITSIYVNQKFEGARKNYINVFVARTSFLLNLIQTAIARGYSSFSGDILIPGLKNYNIFGYDQKRAVKYVGGRYYTLRQVDAKTGEEVVPLGARLLAVGGIPIDEYAAGANMRIQANTLWDWKRGKFYTVNLNDPRTIGAADRNTWTIRHGGRTRTVDLDGLAEHIAAHGLASAHGKGQ